MSASTVIKPVSCIRNPFAPRTGRMVACFPMDDGSGITIANDANARASLGAATIAGAATHSWASDATGGYLDFGTGANYATFGTATGADRLMPEGTVSLVFRTLGDTTSQRPILLSTNTISASTASTRTMISKSLTMSRRLPRRRLHRHRH